MAARSRQFSMPRTALLRLVSARQADAMPPIQDQIAKASSSKATAIRWFTGSWTASS